MKKRKLQGNCDKEPSNSRYNSTHIQQTPLTSTVTPSNRSINENESMKSKYMRNIRHPRQISTEHKNKVTNTGQDDIQKYPDNGKTLVKKLLLNIFYGYVTLQCLKMILSVILKYVPRKYLLFVNCNLVAILKCFSEMFSK